MSDTQPVTGDPINFRIRSWSEIVSLIAVLGAAWSLLTGYAVYEVRIDRLEQSDRQKTAAMAQTAQATERLTAAVAQSNERLARIEALMGLIIEKEKNTK